MMRTSVSPQRHVPVTRHPRPPRPGPPARPTPAGGGSQPGADMADMAGMRIIGAAVATVLIAVASAVPANADPPTFDAGPGSRRSATSTT